jgi:hypothetical protein
MVYVRIVWADVTFLKAVFQFKMLGKFWLTSHSIRIQIQITLYFPSRDWGLPPPPHPPRTQSHYTTETKTGALYTSQLS